MYCQGVNNVRATPSLYHASIRGANYPAYIIQGESCLPLLLLSLLFLLLSLLLLLYLLLLLLLLLLSLLRWCLFP